MVVIAPLPQPPPRIPSPGQGCHRTFDAANQVHDVHVLDHEVDVVGHEAPGVELAVPHRDTVQQECDGGLRQLGMFREPPVARVGGEGEKESVPLPVAGSR